MGSLNLVIIILLISLVSGISVKLDRDDSPKVVQEKLSKNHIGAMRVLYKFYKTSPVIDVFVDPLFGVFRFSDFGIVGSDISDLYEYVCQRSILCVHVIIKSIDLGIESSNNIRSLIDTKCENFEWISLFRKLVALDPIFGLVSDDYIRELETPPRSGSQ